MFRWFFRIDACVMIAVGLLLLGWHDLSSFRPRLSCPQQLCRRYVRHPSSRTRTAG